VVSEEEFRDALARWASGVSVVAVQDPDDGRVYGTTVSSLGSLSADPPRIFFSLGPGAQVLPFLPEEAVFVVNILGEDQRRLAQVFTDSFPVGPSPFPEVGAPVIGDAHVSLICEVDRLVEADPGRIVIGRVVEARVEGTGGPLVRYMRGYRSLA